MFKKLIAPLSLILPLFGVGLMTSYGERACQVPETPVPIEQQAQPKATQSGRVYQAWCGGIF